MNEALVAALARIVNTANEHAARGEERGSEVFAQLYRRGVYLINEYSEPEDNFSAEAPALQNLRALAIPGSAAQLG